MASVHGVHLTQIQQWKKQLLDGAEVVFGAGPGRKRGGTEEERTTADLYDQIGRLKMELEWLKKKLSESVEARRTQVEWSGSKLSLRRQCELLGLNRSTAYYTPASETEENLWLIRRIDERYLKTPWYGSRRMTVWLTQQGLRAGTSRRLDCATSRPSPAGGGWLSVSLSKKCPFLV